MKEELNIDVLEWKIIDISSGQDLRHVYPNGDITYSVGILYLITKYDGVITPDHDEVEEVKWFDLDNLPNNMFDSDYELMPKS